MSSWLISQIPDLDVNITYGVFLLPYHTLCVNRVQYTVMQEMVPLLWDEVTFLALNILEWNKVSLGWWVVNRSTKFSSLNLSIESFWRSEDLKVSKLNREIFLSHLLCCSYPLSPLDPTDSRFGTTSSTNFIEYLLCCTFKSLIHFFITTGGLIFAVLMLLYLFTSYMYCIHPVWRLISGSSNKVWVYTALFQMSVGNCCILLSLLTNHRVLQP